MHTRAAHKAAAKFMGPIFLFACAPTQVMKRSTFRLAEPLQACCTRHLESRRRLCKSTCVCRHVGGGPGRSDGRASAHECVRISRTLVVTAAIFAILHIGTTPSLALPTCTSCKRVFVKVGTCVKACMHACLCACISACQHDTRERVRGQAHSHAHARMHARMHARRHTRTKAWRHVGVHFSARTHARLPATRRRVSC